MVISDKGGEVCTKICHYTKIKVYDKEGESNMEIRKGEKSWTWNMDMKEYQMDEELD